MLYLVRPGQLIGLAGSGAACCRVLYCYPACGLLPLAGCNAADAAASSVCKVNILLQMGH